ncbi:MAG: right-handed parallel beta-helix repeat-containing protein [Propionibacteriaceae bacterium]|nr:right-handed parallel beta-helix repeat-containing protein [Propionibacteriaceae bacterium]
MIIAVAILLASMMILVRPGFSPPPAVAADPGYVLPDYDDYAVVFEINSLDWINSSASCVDQKAGPAADTCTLRQAVISANAVAAASGAVLITIDPDLTIPATAPWVLINTTNYMCSSCGSGVDLETYAWLNMTRANVTIDLQGELGVNAAGTGEFYGMVFRLAADNITLRGFNGAFGPETVINVASGSDHVTLDEIGIDQAQANAYNTVAPNFNWVERGITVSGTVADLTISNSQIGHLYDTDGTSYGAIIFASGARVTGVTIDNVIFDSTVIGSGCSSSSAAACNSSGINATGAVNLTDVTISDSQFRGFSGTNDALFMSSSSNVLADWTWQNVTFTNLTSSNGLYLYLSTLQNWVMDNVTVTGLDVNTSFLYAYLTEIEPSATNPTNGLTIKNSTFGASGSTNTAPYGLLHFVDADGSYITIDNNKFINTVDSATGVYYGGVGAFYIGSFNNVTISNNQLSGNTVPTADDTGIWGFNGAATSVKTLTITNNTSDGDSYPEGWLSLYATGTVQDLTFTGNRLTNQTIKVANGAVIYVAGILGGVNLSGTTTISGNTFSADRTSGNTVSSAHAINWDGTKSSTSTAASGVTITDNYADGFPGTSFLLSATGLVEIRRNTFGPNSASITTNNGQGEETTNSGVMVGNSGANRGIRTWYPTAYTTDSAGCVITVTIQEPTSGTLPVGNLTIDLYKTAGNDAETYLGSVAATPTASQDSVTALIDAEAVANSNLRVQTTGTNTSSRESSQYSRWISIGEVICQEPWTLTKTAYPDANLTVGAEIPDDQVLEAGIEVYWLYQVTNYRLLKGYQIGLTDDQKTTAAGAICAVDLPRALPAGITCSSEPGQATTVCTVTASQLSQITGATVDSGTACQWHQTMKT